MAIREIVCYPDERLLRKSKRVKQVDDQVVKLIEDMAETMYASDGVGLAAPQVGVNRRVVVAHAYQGEDAEGSRLLAVVNPEVVEKSDACEVGEEGCLSVPGLRSDVVRSVAILVRGLGPDGGEVEYRLLDFEARVFQHEIDHLDGILFPDYLDDLTRKAALSEYLAHRGEEVAE